VLVIQDVQGKLIKSQTEVAELEEELDDAEEDIEVSYISELVGNTTVCTVMCAIINDALHWVSKSNAQELEGIVEEKEDELLDAATENEALQEELDAMKQFLRQQGV